MPRSSARSRAWPIAREAKSSSSWWPKPVRSRQIDGPDQGFALFTAGVALQVVAEALGFEEGLRHVVGLGGDTDTNAAVAGALLGALHGSSAIPTSWLDRLAEKDPIEQEAAELAAVMAPASP